MAIFNEILVARYSRSLQKVFGMKGPAAVRQLSGELIPTIQLHHGREALMLEGWQHFGAREFVAAVAAQDSVVRAQNPAGSNTIVVLESIRMWVNVADFVFVEFSAGPQSNLINIPTPAAFDNRTSPPQTGNNQAQLVVSGNNNIGAAGFVTYDEVSVPAAPASPAVEIIQFEDQEIAMLPGSAIQFRDVNLNTQLHVSLRWRERVLEDSEKTA